MDRVLADKVLTVLVLPLGVAVCTGLLTLLAFAFGWRSAAAVLAAFSVLWLWGWSTPFPTMAMIGPLADPYPIQPVETAPAADAIILLGGTTKPIRGDMIYPDLTDSADRIWHAARLYHAGKAPLIIISSGNVSGGLKRPSRARAMWMLLDALGVPDDAVVLEERSRNTRQNAVFTERIAADRGIRRVLLVTSYWHLRRAEAVFRRVGLEVIPVATDYKGRRRKFFVMDILPHIGRLAFNSVLIREHLGYLVYRLRGWV